MLSNPQNLFTPIHPRPDFYDYIYAKKVHELAFQAEFKVNWLNFESLAFADPMMQEDFRSYLLTHINDPNLHLSKLANSLKSGGEEEIHFVDVQLRGLWKRFLLDKFSFYEADFLGSTTFGCEEMGCQKCLRFSEKSEPLVLSNSPNPLPQATDIEINKKRRRNRSLQTPSKLLKKCRHCFQPILRHVVQLIEKYFNIKKINFQQYLTLYPETHYIAAVLNSLSLCQEEKFLAFLEQCARQVLKKKSIIFFLKDHPDEGLLLLKIVQEFLAFNNSDLEEYMSRNKMSKQEKETIDILKKCEYMLFLKKKFHAMEKEL